jgi:hypothetical protein
LDVPVEFDYQPAEAGSLPVVWSPDPDYQGHGCQLPWRSATGSVDLRPIDDTAAPACAACMLAVLAHVGVRYYKIAGRGYPGSIVARAVRFLRDALYQLGNRGIGAFVCAGQIRDNYARTFGRPCTQASCYYQPLRPKT